MEVILNRRILNLVMYILLMVGILTVNPVLHAQAIKTELKPGTKSETDKEEERSKLDLQPFSLEKMGLLEPSIQALEQAVNPDEYLVGPGDIFYVNTAGEGYLPATIIVTPEGKIIIPSVGSLDVAGKTLTEVKRIILEQGNKKYKSDAVQASLVQIRNFRVHVLGEIEKPGTYMAQPIDRVSVMIERAGGITGWADERKISIRHLDGNYNTCDLFEFYNKGNLNGNIYVQSGDVIYVPPIKLSRKTVTIDGIMEKSGVYQILDGETVEDFLLRVDALNKKIIVSDIYLVRNAAEGNKRVVKTNLFGGKNNLPSNANLTLEDGDIIYAPSIKDYVYVAGAVQQPGSYPFFLGFLAIDYVGIAGGIIEMGRIEDIKIFREKNQTFETGANVIIERGDTIFVPTTFRRRIIEYIQIVSSLTTIGLFIFALQK